MNAAVNITTRHWVRLAACRNSSLFFGEMNESSTARRRRENQAKKVCARCPVKGDCLEYALRVDEPLGIWGGLDPSERRARDRGHR